MLARETVRVSAGLIVFKLSVRPFLRSIRKAIRKMKPWLTGIEHCVKRCILRAGSSYRHEHLLGELCPEKSNYLDTGEVGTVTRFGLMEG